MNDRNTSFNLELEFKPMQGYGGGFRTEWITATDEADKSGFSAGLDSGGGFGNPLLTFWVQSGKKGERRYYTADMRLLLQAAIAKVEES